MIVSRSPYRRFKRGYAVPPSHFRRTLIAARFIAVTANIGSFRFFILSMASMHSWAVFFEEGYRLGHGKTNGSAISSAHLDNDFFVADDYFALGMIDAEIE